MMKGHCMIGKENISRLPFSKEVKNAILYHHEEANGKEPFGKKGEELSFEERMMAYIDIYQALTEERPYKKGFSHDKTIEIMRDMAAKNMLD